MADLRERAHAAAGIFTESLTDSRQLRGELFTIADDSKAGSLPKAIALIHAALIFTDMVPLAIGEAAEAFIIPPEKLS